MEFVYMYSVVKFQKTPISTNKEGIACFVKKKKKKNHENSVTLMS